MTESQTITRLTPKVGDIVIDASQSDTYGPRYAIGKKGFLSLDTGDFIPYDSAFPGVEYFDRPEFVIAETQRAQHMSNDAAEALEQVDYEVYRLKTATTLPAQAEAMIALCNAMSNLRTWHPGYVDGGHAEATLPWEREDAEFNA